MNVEILEPSIEGCGLTHHPAQPRSTGFDGRNRAARVVGLGQSAADRLTVRDKKHPTHCVVVGGRELPPEFDDLASAVVRHLSRKECGLTEETKEGEQVFAMLRSFVHCRGSNAECQRA